MIKLENLKSKFLKQKNKISENNFFKNFNINNFKKVEVKRILRNNSRKFLVGFLCLFLVYSFYPVKSLFNPSFLTQKHLVIFLNQAESRPCGGFATGFGEVQIIPPKFFFKNVYSLEKENLGAQRYPLSLVSKQKKFWDLGDSENLSYCGKNFLFGYNQITQKDLKSVILVNFNFLERWLNILGEVQIGTEKITAQNFFATLSRKVANIDRHDEKSLKNRKSLLSELAKKLVLKTFFKPQIWHKVSALIKDEIKSGNIYIENISPDISSKEENLKIIEWNLGGGKSSRYLRKNIKISLQEISPQNWVIKTKLKVDHLGSFDEPLSQKWKGVFEIQMPKFLGSERHMIEAEIHPKNSFEQSWENSYLGEISDFSFFKPPSQDWNLEFLISAFGQQNILSENLKLRENTAQFFGNLKNSTTQFNWKIKKDLIKPFITLHEFISSDIIKNSPEEKVWDLEEKNPSEFLFVEIHFNEKVELQNNFAIALQDRNYTNDITLKPEFKKAVLLKDKTTLLAKFKITDFQNGERYFVKITGIIDLFKNSLEIGDRTIITR